jgi:hypothetical protein
MADNDEREFILRDCADRLSLLEDGPVSVDQVSQIIMDRLAETATVELMACAKLGKVIWLLNRDLEAEMSSSKGMYGLGKVFRAGFEKVAQATGTRSTDAQIDQATNVLLDKFLGKVYELAEVER